MLFLWRCPCKMNRMIPVRLEFDPELARKSIKCWNIKLKKKATCLGRQEKWLKDRHDEQTQDIGRHNIQTMKWHMSLIMVTLLRTYTYSHQITAKIKQQQSKAFSQPTFLISSDNEADREEENHTLTLPSMLILSLLEFKVHVDFISSQLGVDFDSTNTRWLIHHKEKKCV